MAGPVQVEVQLPELTAAQQTQLDALEEELRCLVCQNQTLAESGADVARDLRNLVHKLVASGKSDEEIKTYLVERYSDFVLYKPPFKAKTAVLWLGPFVLLLIGALTWFVIGRRQAMMAQTARDDDSPATTNTSSGTRDTADPPGTDQNARQQAHQRAAELLRK